MDESARSLLLELMSKSKQGLSDAEQLCTQAHDELHACQGHANEIEKIYSKLCFVSRQIKAQAMTVESLLRIAYFKLNGLMTITKELQRELKGVSSRLDQALKDLRSTKVDKEIQKNPSSNSTDNPKATVLFDFLDDVSLQQLQTESSERMQRIVGTTQRLQELVFFLTDQRSDFKSYLMNAITLDDSAISFAREKMHLQEQHTTTMAESLVSLANHYDQVVQVLRADVQPMSEELEVLDSDTIEAMVIVGELVESLALVKATSEEVSVREHQYATAYQEATDFFGRIENLEPDLVQLIGVFKDSEELAESIDAAGRLIGELDSLAIWYEEFHNSYEAMTVEIVRRHHAHQVRQKMVKDFFEQMEVSYTNEVNARTLFSEHHGKFLPVDLCPTFAEPPVEYEVLSHGNFQLPMPSRATLQLVESRLEDMRDIQFGGVGRHSSREKIPCIMFIKQIIIQGFKSYKNQTVIEPFSGKHNVIVGRNGSGKSNFFAAIRFVLSDAYTNMGREERQALLHEGSGAATMSAYVEIIFDNTDNRFPTGRDELILRRTIGLTKDEYSIDRKNATKSEVMNMLEMAGFSRSNPYYIVPQGRITSLTNAKDNERLQLLKEVAGTRVYEQRRQESVKIFSETEAKRKNIEELLSYIDERLAELEEEKEELKLYQQHDRRRRCLEYTIYSREQKDINEALEEMEEQHRQEVDGSNQQQRNLQDKEARISVVEEEISERKQHMELLLAEKRQLDYELESHIKLKAQLELSIQDHENNMEQTSERKQRQHEERSVIEEEILSKELELSQVIPEFQRREEEEQQLREELAQTELQRQALYSKQGRSGQFKTKAQRDAWIRNEMGDIQQSIDTQTSQVSSLDEDLSTLKTRLVDVSTEVQELRLQEVARKAESETLLEELIALKTERDTFTDRRKELWREDAKLDSTLNILKEEQRKSERSVGASMDKHTSAGLAAVARIAKENDLVGVYGPLYELFDVEDQYDVAVNVTAGASLFHVVVDSDTTATRVLEALNKEKAGRVTFMPLNRLSPMQSTYPEASDAIPMIRKLRYDPKFTKAMEHVFGRALICRTLEIAATYSRSFGLNGITLDGDRVDRKGALTGGFQDRRTSRLSSVKSLKTFNAKYQAAVDRCDVVKQEIASLDQKITSLLNQIQVTEARRKQLHDKRETMMIDARSLSKEEANLKEAADVKEKAHRNIQTDLRALQAQLASLGEELKSDMVQSLSRAEHNLLSELVAKSTTLKERLSDIAIERSKLETHKNVLEITLSSNLRPRLEEIRDKIENGAVSSESGLEKRRLNLNTALKAIESIKARVQGKYIDEDTEANNKLVTEREAALEKLQTELHEESRQMRRIQKDAERYVSRRNLLLRKKESCTKNIRELGVLPEEAFEKYRNVSSQKLLKQIHKVNEELKKYSHVNKKAFEQYSSFTKQRDSLIQRKEELDASEIAIRDLIQTLDQRKDEAIERTFKQVAKNFSEVFVKLVPAGRGRLIMQRQMDPTPDVEEEEEHENSVIDNYSGVAIQVSFNSKVDEGLRMQQLSGGQKSLVALTLIFAIQQCDPAPFYLFDEIDANLDAAHRTAVASMIHSLSAHAQFITTTFRPEMLTSADKFYGVSFQDKVSLVSAITKEEALEFVEQEQPH
ncbi:Structural maintenance of chromosomes protein 3 [Lunasporangiospora selenospora]|uniref:Structural maintenance of chromosomes protein 3 n=1 Tax=Lunasporangiospora selenospora TaxID=979761 RepID=A0A9P6G2M2_9FUNG|nr:Structural maintenance of chromosomes protein 3 [Lunasporangiospora selenospora]